MIGRQLAHYRIHALLGRGGMGEVYQATDTKLQRQVALKLLPAQMSEDPERQARFAREAQTLASLHHPNVASIFGLEEEAGIRFLVLELAEGEDLATRISQGAMLLEDVTSIALQIVEGLESAHEQNIVHRDLKPANIRVSAAGAVKILDFGLARAFSGGVVGEEDPILSPTITAAHTQAGTILGTAAYMSPEQARGKPVDKRTDIWAFGVIVWEMLTGKRLFAGETITDVLAAVVREEPDFSQLPGDMPPGIRQLLLRCLQRDPRQRLRDIGEARLLLSADPLLSQSSIISGMNEAPAKRRRVWQFLPWVLLLLAIVLLPAIFSNEGPSLATPLRKFEFRTGESGAKLSPDGTSFVYKNAEGIWLRVLADGVARLLVSANEIPMTDESQPGFSYDGQHVVYVSDNKLWKISIAGGQSTRICVLDFEVTDLVWTASDWIIIAGARKPIYRVRAQGGTPEILVPTSTQELDYHNPSLLPDGESILYSVHRPVGVDTIEMLVGGERVLLLREEILSTQLVGDPQLFNSPCYSPTGHLLFQRDKGNIGVWAIGFDPKTAKTHGDAFIVAANAQSPSVSQDGLLLYGWRNRSEDGQIVLVSRQGEILRTVAEHLKGASRPSFSPDGKRLAFLSSDRSGGQIFTYDLELDQLRQLTTDERPKLDPTWIPGTGDMAYSMPDSGCRAIFVQAVDGSGSARRLLSAAAEPTFLPGGSEFVYTAFCAAERGIRRHLPNAEPTVLLANAAGVDRAEFSTDGRYLLYRDWASGQPTFFISDYPEMKGRWRVGVSDLRAHWGPDSRSVLYVRQDENPALMELPVNLDSGVAIGTVRELFRLRQGDQAFGTYEVFDISPDGESLAMVSHDVAAQPPSDTMLIENWYQEFQEER